MLESDFGAGLADPVHDAQGNFRAILDALAHPGTVQGLVATTDAPAGLTPELASVVLTLCDHDTPIWLSPALDVEPVRSFIGFHAGAPILGEQARSNFAFVGPGDVLPPLAGFNLGSDEYPDRSTTLVVAVSALTGGSPIVLRGPGISVTQMIDPIGLPENFATQWTDNRALFPRGVDLLLVANGTVLGLPRSSRIVGEG